MTTSHGRERMRPSVMDFLGRELAVPQNGVVEAGRHSVPFDAAFLRSGAYLYRLVADGVARTKSIRLIG